MGCLKITSVFVVVLAVAIGSGLLPRAIVHFGKWRGEELFTGLSPLFMTKEELRAAPIDGIPAGVLNGKTCLVTGGNAGLGFSTSEHLARKGCDVVVVGRREKAVQEACSKIEAYVKADSSKGSCKAMIADLADVASVRAFTTAFLASHDRLDVAVLNAGVADFWGSHELQKNAAGIEINFAVNHLGHFAMLQDLEALVATTGREQGDARIVVVSSAGHFSSAPDVGVHLTLDKLNSDTLTGSLARYGQSKLANILFAQSLSKRLSASNVYVNSVHPGTVRTNIVDPFFDLVRGAGEKYPVVEPVTSAFLKAFLWGYDLMCFTAEDGARTQIWLAASPQIAKKKVTGKYFHPHAVEVTPSKFTKRKVDGKLLEDALWTFSEQLLDSK